MTVSQILTFVIFMIMAVAMFIAMFKGWVSKLSFQQCAMFSLFMMVCAIHIGDALVSVPIWALIFLVYFLSDVIDR